MAIDKVMLGAVRHYLMGMAAAARAIHSEIQETGHSFDYAYSENNRTLGGDIDNTRNEFLLDCGEMLRDPVPERYAHRREYHLSHSDRSFLTKLCKIAEQANWRNPEEVAKLILAIDEYAPHGGFESGS